MPGRTKRGRSGTDPNGGVERHLQRTSTYSVFLRVWKIEFGTHGQPQRSWQETLIMTTIVVVVTINVQRTECLTMHMLLALSVQPRVRAGRPNIRTRALTNSMPIRFLAPRAPSEWASSVFVARPAKSRNATAATSFERTTSRSVAVKIPFGVVPEAENSEPLMTNRGGRFQGIKAGSGRLGSSVHSPWRGEVSRNNNGPLAQSGSGVLAKVKGLVFFIRSILSPPVLSRGESVVLWN